MICREFASDKIVRKRIGPGLEEQTRISGKTDFMHKMKEQPLRLPGCHRSKELEMEDKDT